MSECEPEEILLFGSHASGNADEWSDIDVIVVSKAFAEIPFMKRMPYVLRLINFEKHVDAICYSPQEFEDMKTKSSVIMDALDNGVRLV